MSNSLAVCEHWQSCGWVQAVLQKRNSDKQHHLAQVRALRSQRAEEERAFETAALGGRESAAESCEHLEQTVAVLGSSRPRRESPGGTRNEPAGHEDQNVSPDTHSRHITPPRARSITPPRARSATPPRPSQTDRSPPIERSLPCYLKNKPESVAPVATAAAEQQVQQVRTGFGPPGAVLDLSERPPVLGRMDGPQPAKQARAPSPTGGGSTLVTKKWQLQMGGFGTVASALLEEAVAARCGIRASAVRVQPTAPLVPNTIAATVELKQVPRSAARQAAAPGGLLAGYNVLCCTEIRENLSTRPSSEQGFNPLSNDRKAGKQKAPAQWEGQIERPRSVAVTNQETLNVIMRTAGSCSKCGNTILEDSQFCRKCGAKMDRVVSRSSSALSVGSQGLVQQLAALDAEVGSITGGGPVVLGRKMDSSPHEMDCELRRTVSGTSGWEVTDPMQ